MLVFFTSPARAEALENGPGGSLLRGFAEELYRLRYAEITARRYIRAAEHLAFWSARIGVPLAELNDDAVGRFERHIARCRCPRYGRSQRTELRIGARKFLHYLQDGSVATTRAAPPSEDPALLVGFCRWMRQQRGTARATLDNYCRPIRGFLRQLGEEPNGFNAHDIRQFVLDKHRTSGLATTKTCTTALRMFLRYLIAEGQCAADLDGAIPVIAHWRLSSLPRYLQPEDVERIISSCDDHSPVGKRDRAILLLLARLALRAGDILRLRLHDVDWEGARIKVCGKGRRETWLPLTQEVGDAIASYLRDGRPPSDADVLFIRSRAPFRPFTSHCAISVIVDRAMKRAGVARPSRGAAHLLRHSAATSMLRQGASLQDIATVLRHRSVETTQIYAKVDLGMLTQITQPWPEAPTC